MSWSNGLLAFAVMFSASVPPNQLLAQDSDQNHKSQIKSESKQATEYYDLGGYHNQVSTKSPTAQAWFDRGLAMCHAFNHEEAVRCFEKSLAADPGMPMALWGMAYAWGPNINFMDVPPHQLAQGAFALRLASLQTQRGTQVEQALINALASRYAAPAPEDRKPLNRAYAEAMRKVYKQHPGDPLVAALWGYWNPAGEPIEETSEQIAVLETALKRWPEHPALCHFYIHTMEASPNPAKALPAANALRQRMPGAGHLVHMPTHIDVRLGNYEEVVAANALAIKADQKFLEDQGPLNFYSYYRIHNYHFLVYGAMFDGQSELALRTAREIPKQIPEAMLKEQSDFLDAFMPMSLHVLVRFGRWDEILKEPEPAKYLPFSRAVRHYARALAFAAQGDVENASEEQDAFLDARDQVPETSYLFQNPSLNILGVAEAMIEGEIAYREGKFEDAFARLREAVDRDDALNYDEPWGWMQPARHALGALLLEQGRAAEAEAVYRDDLRHRPKNPWALHGLAESLQRQEKSEEAVKFRAQFDVASKRADVKIDRSCFCRTLEVRK